jgi:MinD-like ATPase involved in chromosome partitioning or flagellar assembly
VTGGDRGGDRAGDRIPVLLAVTGRPYEEALLAALGHPGSRMRVARRCLDLADLLAVSGTTTATVAVVWSGLHRLDREAFARLSANGVGIVAVVEPAGPVVATEQVRRALDVGAGAVVLAPGPSDATAVASFVADVGARAMATHLQRARAPAAVATAATAATARSSMHETGDRAPGRLVVVWGPIGAPGRTTLAVEIADEAARLGVPATLADADTYGPSIAQRLGILDEGSGMAAAARAANAGTLDATTLSAVARALPSGLRVLTGLTRADRWPELPVPALDHVWRVARSSPGVTVVDAGFCLEEDDELSFDAVPLRRNAATLSSLAAADAVVVVGCGDPVGLARLLRAGQELDELAERRPGAVPAARRVVVNRVRPAAVGGRHAGRRVAELLGLDLGAGNRAELGRRRPAPVLVPDDPLAFDRAVAAGRTLAETAPRSPARGPVAALARELAEQLELL